MMRSSVSLRHLISLRFCIQKSLILVPAMYVVIHENRFPCIRYLVERMTKVYDKD